MDTTLVRVRQGRRLAHADTVHNSGTVLELPSRVANDPAVRESVEAVVDLTPTDRVETLTQALAAHDQAREALIALLAQAKRDEEQARREAADRAAAEAASADAPNQNEE